MSTENEDNNKEDNAKTKTKKKSLILGHQGTFALLQYFVICIMRRCPQHYHLTGENEKQYYDQHNFDLFSADIV